MIIENSKVSTEEVKQWKGLHLLHFQLSTCSLKVRLMLRELGVTWHSHPVNLPKHENATTWFLGINPRGVVPVLVHDGVVHVESNDIIEYLDKTYAEPESSFFFPESDPKFGQAQKLLSLEDSLHSNLRLLTVTFGPLGLKSKKQIADYESNGVHDEHRKKEIRWWLDKATKPITHEEIATACEEYRRAFVILDAMLENNPYLMGSRMSIVDIAWFTNIQRLVNLGYPLARHKNLNAYYKRLITRKAFAAERKIPMSRLGTVVFSVVRGTRRLKGKYMAKYVAA